jgi:hypothetical protein
MAGLLALVFCSASAQSTDVVQRATFALKGTMQTSSGVKSVRMDNKDILAALNGSGAYHFGPKATLLLVVSDNQPVTFIVEEKNSVQTRTTDVSALFGVTEIGEAVHSPDGSTAWATWHFGFDNGNTNETAFRLWGSTTIRRGPIHTPGIGTVAGPQRVQCSVRGVGRLKGVITIFSGNFSGANPALIND